MKANELMIEDWVFNKNINKPIQVYPMMFSQMFRKRPNATTEDYNIFPIPLTPEILEKNGHKVPDYAVWDLEDAGAEVQWMPETMDTINPPMQYRLAPRQKHFGVQETLICHIKYVHELQHALRICGIDKTIEL